jgi:hypothetical protein
MRCKACDSKITYISWRKNLKIFEDLCLACRESIYLAPTNEELLEDFGYTEVKDELS